MTDNFLGSETSPKTVSEDYLVVNGVSIKYTQHEILRDMSFGLELGEMIVISIPISRPLASIIIPAIFEVSKQINAVWFSFRFKNVAV